MKTLFIMLSRGFAARNILRTEVFRILKEQKDLRVVVFVPFNIPDYFREEMSHPRVILEETAEIQYGLFRRRIWSELLHHLVYTSTSQFMTRYPGRLNLGRRRRVAGTLGFFFLNLIFSAQSRVGFLKTFYRWVEMNLFPDKNYDHFFRKYAPDLVFAATVAAKRDIAMIKAARRFGVPVVGMTRGWDNLDRFFLPVVPDRLIVQNTLMTDLAVRLHAVPEAKVTVVGFPQFDLYADPSVYRPREDFLRSLGLDPARKLIFYGSEGQWWGPHDEHIVRILHRLVQENAFPFPCSLIIRPHFSDYTAERFKELVGAPNTYIDATFRITKFFADLWDPSREEMLKLANEFRHCDVLVCMASTLALEAALFDKPVVNVDFYADSEPDNGPYFGRWYDSSHYRGVVETGGVRLARNPDELHKFISSYLTDSSLDRAGRATLAERYCFSKDGRAGERIAKLLLQELKMT
ncbi:hypothetical protein EPN90_03020 [Patescibacteria group bacterium]|nr:MAG: hypothetical protein EPN90_03020 [Patescibacteria group bacterium]